MERRPTKTQATHPERRAYRRDAAKAKDLAAALGGGGTTAGTSGTAPADDIVVLAVPYRHALCAELRVLK